MLLKAQKQEHTLQERARQDVYCTHTRLPLQESLTSLLLSELAYKQADEVAAAAAELRAGLPEGLFTFDRIQWSQDHVEHRSGPKGNAVCTLAEQGRNCMPCMWYGWSCVSDDANRAGVLG